MKKWLVGIFLIFISARAVEFRFSTIDNQTVGKKFHIKIEAVEGGSVISDYNKTAQLTTNKEQGVYRYILPEEIQFNAGVYEGNVEITLAVSGISIKCFNSDATGESNSFDVAAGDFANILLLLEGETPLPGTDKAKEGNAEITAGDTINAVILLTDKYYNKVSSESASVALSSTDPFFIGVDTVDVHDSTSVKISLRTVKEGSVSSNWSVNAKYESMESSSGVKVNVGSFTNLILLLPGESLLPGDTSSFSSLSSPGKDGPAEITYQQGVPCTLYVYATDKCWNWKKGETGNITITDQLNRPMEIVESPVLDDGSARSIIKFSDAQDYNIQPEMMGKVSYRSKIKVLPGVNSITLKAKFDPIQANAGDSIFVQIDPVANGVAVSFSIIKGSENASLTDTLVYTDHDGMAYTVFTAQKDGVYTIKASTNGVDTTLNITVSSSSTISLNPNPFYPSNDTAEVEISYPIQRLANSVTFYVLDGNGEIVYKKFFSSGSPETAEGRPSIMWDGMNGRGLKVPSGVYLIAVRIEDSDGIHVYRDKIMLIR